MAEEDRVIIGYAYAGIFMTEGHMTGQRRCRFMCRRGIHGKGVGTALYEKMEELLKKAAYREFCLPALPHPNAESEAFMRRVDMRRRHILNNVATSLASGGILYGCRR